MVSVFITMASSGVSSNIHQGEGQAQAAQPFAARHKDEKQIRENILRASEAKGAVQLAVGAKLALRKWEIAESTKRLCAAHESLGYCLGGEAALCIPVPGPHSGSEPLEERVIIRQGESWMLPANAVHHYTVLKAPFICLEGYNLLPVDSAGAEREQGGSTGSSSVQQNK